MTAVTCPDCWQRCKSRSGLATHARARHGRTSPAVPDATVESTLATHLRAELVRYLVGRKIFCPLSGHVLDARTCVVLADADGDPAHVFSPEGWAKAGAERQAAVLSLPGVSLYRGPS